MSTLDKLNQDMISVMDRMTAYVSTNERLLLPKPSNEFTAIQQLIRKTDLNVVVCGKVKNGKSSLINAIIGRELLPVSSDVATSQIFKLVQSKEDDFKIIYSNGNKQTISEKQLFEFGSQREINLNGVKNANQSISFIEIGTQMEFLPEGVSLVDSPGIGSTYPQHTAITKNCVQMADAAIFVLNPTPLEKLEIEFLKELVNITRNIMFVMTKSEDVDSVKQNIARNTKLIQDAIGDSLYREVNILPISSTTLMAASKSVDIESADFNLVISGYNEVKAELLNLVALAKGYYRVGEAYNYSLQYYNLVLDNLKNRLAIAKADGEKNIANQNKINEARTRLVNFGRVKQRQLIDEVDIRLRAFAQTFQQKMSLSGGPVISKYITEIDNLSSDELQSYADSLGNKIIDELQHEWEQLQHVLESEISGILSEYSSLIQNSRADDILIIPTNQNSIGTLERVSFRKRALNARNEAMIGIGGLTIMSFLGATAIPVVGPVIVLSALGYTLYGLFAGNTRAKAEVLNSNKNRLKQFAQDTIKDFYKQYTEVSLEDGKYSSIIDGYRQAIRSYAIDSITEIYSSYEKELQALEEIQNGNKSESVVLLNGIIERWSSVQPNLLSIREQLEAINSSL